MRKLAVATAIAGVMAAVRRSGDVGGPASTPPDPARLDHDRAGRDRSRRPDQRDRARGHDSSASGHDATAPSDVTARGWTSVAKRTLGQISDDNVPMVAAAVAFASLLALFPAMIAAVSLFGLVADPATISELTGRIARSLPADAASLVTDQLAVLAEASSPTLGTSLALSLATSIWGASKGVDMLVRGLNVAYDEEDGRGFVHRKALSLLFTVAGLVLFVVALGVIAVAPRWIDGLGLGVLGESGARVGTFAAFGLVLLVGLASLYRWGPDRDPPRWAWLSPGTLLAVVLWLAASVGFAWFAENVGAYNDTYGAISGVIVLMLWLQLSAFAILLGAELNAETERQTARDTTTGEPEPLGDRGADAADHVAGHDEDAVRRDEIDVRDGANARRREYASADAG